MSITLAVGASSYTLKQPYFMYDTIIHMGLHYSRTQSGYKIGDDTSTYDWRMCDIPTWLLNNEDQLVLHHFTNDLALARSQNFTMTLPASSGFFPFGADKGDTGAFVCSVWQHDKKGVQLNPYLQHANNFKMMFVSGPAYTPPAAEAEGTLEIGTVSTLRPLQTLPETIHDQSVIREVSRGGVVSSVDIGPSGDLFESSIDLEMRPGNCAALITYLTTIRSGDIEITAPTNSWLFGAINDSGGVYTTKLLSNEIKITHDNYNLFKTRLKFWMKSNDNGG